jgi:hypothetical protein
VNSTWEIRSLDENYQIYLNRILRTTLPETHRSQLQHIQRSPKFVREGGSWTPVPFPGYTVVTPTGKEDHKNAPFYDSLAAYQTKLSARLGQDLFIPVPPSSFHLTLADVIWDSNYTHSAETPGFDERLRHQIAQSFQNCQPFVTNQPIRFQVLGLMVMTRSIALSLAATDEMGYFNILNMRRSIYQNPGLIELGIEQQYYFTPHITLGYFGDLGEIDRGQLDTALEEMNEPWIGTAEQEFWVNEAQVRKFSDMYNYDREPEWPTFQF